MHQLLDGESQADPLVQRLLAVDRICRGFHCLPRDAARELEEDPEHMALLILDIREYVAAKQAFDRASDKVKGLDAWKGSPYMTLVETNTFELRRSRRTRG